MPRRYRRGSTLYYEGEDCSRVWVVKSGSVALLRASGDDAGAGRAVALRGPRSIVGIETLVGQTYLHTATVATEARLCAIDADRFAEWIGPRDSPSYAALVNGIETAIDDERRCLGATGSATRRVITWLLDESDSLPLDTPRHFVADLLGIRPETLSRILVKLSGIRAIELSRTSLSIADRRALEQLIG